MEILSIIPARSRSKGIKNKNIIDIMGKPMVSYSIEVSLNSSYINRTIVSTDSEEYANICKNFGADVPFLRPKELAKDEVHSIYPIIDCINKLKEAENYTPDIIVMLLPTSPLRKSFHIDESIKLYFEHNDFESTMISVVESDKHPRYFKRIVNGYLEPYEKSTEAPNFQRQDLEKLYEGNGSIFIAPRNLLLSKKTFHTSKVYPYIMEKKYSVDVNNYWDLKLVNLLLEEERGKNDE